MLQLQDGAYAEYSVAGRGSQAVSALLEGFTVDVAETLDAI